MYGGQPVRGMGDFSAGGADAVAYSEACSMLQHKSRSELEKLMNDNDQFDSFVNGLSMVKKLGTDKEAIMVSNLSLAEYNISQEPRLISAREDLAQQYSRLVELQKQCERIMLRVESSTVHSSPETSLALLQAELAKAEEESDKVAEDFSASGRSGDVDSFISQYVTLRTLAHMRRVKVDKLTEKLHSVQHASAVSVAPASALPPVLPQRQPYSSGPSGPPIASQGWNANPPVPNGWSPYPQPYPSATPSYQPVPPVASYMHR